MIIRKCTTNGSKYVEIRDPFLHAIICIYILYEFCIQIVYITFMMYTFGRSELKYTKCTQNVCIQNVSHISTNFCIHFVYKMYTKSLCTKCIPHFDKLLYRKCIQNVFIQNVPHISTNFCMHFQVDHRGWKSWEIGLF